MFPDAAARRGASRGPILLLVILAAAAWLPSVGSSGFALDDREVLFGNPVVEGDLPLSAVFDRDYWNHRGDAGHYRPLATLSLRLDRAWSGERAAGYHATNVLLHVLVVLVAALAWSRLAPQRVPLLGLALFACHPALADAVAWISGRTAMLSVLGGLVGVHLAIGSRARARAFVAGFAASLGALLAKEDGAVFGAATVLVAPARLRGSALAGACTGIAAALSLRTYALGEFLPSAPHAPLAHVALGERLVVGGLAVVEGLKLAAAPFAHAPLWTADALAPGLAPAARSAVGMLGLLVPAAALALAAPGLFRAAARRGPSATGVRFDLRCSATLCALAVLPLLQLVPAGEVFAPRWLYLPLLLGAPLVEVGLRSLLPAARTGQLALVGVLLGALVVASWSRCDVYASRAAFRKAVLRHRPDDAPSWNDLGVAHWEAGDRAGAERAFERSAALDPNYSRPWTNLGNLALEEGRLDHAVESLTRAVILGPRQPLAHLALGNALRRVGRAGEAVLACERAVELAPGLAAGWRALARAREASGDEVGARSAARRAAELDPGRGALPPPSPER